jgi:hypothetical protein
VTKKFYFLPEGRAERLRDGLANNPAPERNDSPSGGK